MAKLIIKDNRCFIKEEKDTDFLWGLDKEISFKVDGAEYMPMFKAGRWDGRIRLLDSKTLSFAIGLLKRVSAYYSKHSKELIIEDLRTFSQSKPIDISQALKAQGREPYEHQIRALEATRKFDRGIIRAATGAGKTLIAAMVIADIGKSSNIYVIGKDLLYQFHEQLSSVFDEKIGLIGDGKCIIENINVISLWTASAALGLSTKGLLEDEDDTNDEEDINQEKYGEIREILKKAAVHIIDECHVCTSDTVKKLNEYILPEHMYGLSGTPYRSTSKDMMTESILGDIIVDISASELIDKKLLAKPIIKFVSIPKYTGGKSQYQSIYKDYIIENLERNDIIVHNVEVLIEKGYKPLVLFKNIKHGNILADIFKERGIRFDVLNGNDSMNVRLRVKEKFNNDEIDVILASQVFDIGVDIPKINALILAGSGKSKVRALQRIGRAIRKSPGKSIAAIIDFYDNAKYLRDHSKARAKIYQMEPGFEIYLAQGM